MADRPASPRVLAEWRSRVAAEYRSAAIAAGVVQRAIVVGFPEPLLHTGLRIVRDELDHASLSHQCLVDLGGADQPVELLLADLAGPTDAPVFPALLDAVVRDFCLGETLAVPLFHRMRQGTRHPAVMPALTRILADESIHRQYGWDALDELVSRDPPGVRAYVGDRLGPWLDQLREAYAPEGESPALDEDERAAGLMPLSAYREVFWETVTRDLARRFSTREIPFSPPSAR